MSGRGASAYHEAQLLDGRLRRLQARRERQKSAVDSAFNADLLAMLQAAQPWLRQMVRQSIAQDHHQGELLAAIDVAEVALDPHERETDAPAPIELAADDVELLEPDTARRAALLAAANDADGNAEWGLPPAYRYPEPGEAAVVLPSGETVAAENAP